MPRPSKHSEYFFTTLLARSHHHKPYITLALSQMILFAKNGFPLVIFFHIYFLGILGGSRLNYQKPCLISKAGRNALIDLPTLFSILMQLRHRKLEWINGR